MQLYKQLHEKLSYLEADKIEQIYQAYLFALESHFGQKRESGEKFITHPIAVASILADMRIDYQSIIVALLHDVIEDTLTTKEKIVAKFGQEVADLVDGVTKLDRIESSSKDETHAQNFRKMVLAMSRDIRVILIKLADRLHNMQTIDSVAPIKRHRVAKETLDIYAPIANRLGMYKMCIKLENLAFAALYPRRNEILEKSMGQVYGKNKEVMKLIERELKEAFSKNSLKDLKIVGRTKHLYGVYKKMLDHRASFASVTDVYAFRIIVQSIDDCYRALGIVHGLYKPLPGKFKDYIAMPKFNGYQSLHTVLFGPYGAPVEIQIRTQLMDQTANNGIAAHWLYKTGSDVADVIHIRAQQWVNDLLEMQQNTSSSAEFLENLKIDLFPDKVYVFTPKGSIMELTRGATVVDFAYAVHTDIGNSCIAARINRKFLPLSTVLLNGQTVSVVTSRAANPNPEWLNFVTTSKARHCIRHYIKNKKRSELVVLGKQLLDKAFSDLQCDFQKIDSNAIAAFLEKSGFKTLDDLYEDIGLGKHLSILVAYQLTNSGESQKKKEDKCAVGAEDKPLLIRGVEGVAINFASCCYPIPGDSISGYLNVGSGLDIHTKDCPSLAKLCNKHPEKCLSVSWAEDVSGSFCVVLDVEVTDQLGVLAELTQAIAKVNADIYNIVCGERSGGDVLVSLHLLVRNLPHLRRVELHISNVPNVISVIRRKGL